MSVAPSPVNRLLHFALATGRLSQTVSATLDEQSIVQITTSQIVSEGLAGAAILWLADDAGMLRVASRNAKDEAMIPGQALAAKGQARAGRILADGKPVVTTRLRTIWDAGEIEALRAAGIQTYAAFVLAETDKPSGVLELFHSAVFTSEESRVLDEFAAHLARSLDHARRFSRAQDETASARLTNSLSSALSESAAPADFARRAAEAIGALGLAGVVVVNLWMRDDQAACRGEHRASADLPSLAAFAEGEQHPPVARYLLTTASPVVIDSAASSPNFIVQRLHSEVNLASLCCMPVISGEEVRGSIDLYRFETERPWRQSEVMQVQQAARQLSWALRSFEPRSAGKDEEPAEEFMREIRQSLDSQGILSAAVQALANHFGALRVYGLILPPGIDWQHPVPWPRVVAAEALRDSRTCLDQPFPVEGDLLLEAVSSSFEPQAIEDVTLTSYLPSPVRARLGFLGVRSLLVAPIVFNNQVNGLLSIHHGREHRWHSKDLAQIKRLTGQLAIAIKYVRLFEEAAAETKRMRTLVETLGFVLQPASWHARLNALLSRLRRVLSADIAFAVEVTSDGAQTLPASGESFHEQYPGPLARGISVPLAGNPPLSLALGSPHVVASHLSSAEGWPSAAEEFYRTLEIKSLIAVAQPLHTNRTLIIVLASCSRDRAWREEEGRLFEEITSLISLGLGHQLEAELGIAEPVKAEEKAETEMQPADWPAAAESAERLSAAAAAETVDDREFLERANRSLEELVSIAAHDLQSPLVSIEGYLSKLEQEINRGSPEHPLPPAQPIERIRVNIAQMQRLIRSLLDVSKLRSDAGLAESVDVRSVVERLRAELQPKLDAQGAELIVRGDLPVVKGSRVRVGQIFSNLVNNALNYRHPQRAPVVEIGFSPRGAEYEFSVRDNGIGIRPEDFDKLFKPLSRLKYVDVQGTGMGLYIVQRIIEKHGGHIWVDSSEGAGATFHFTLPRA